MTFARLVERFDGLTEIPVEIGEVRAAILDLEVQDEIILAAGDMDPGKLRGIFYRYRRTDVPYGDAIWATLIIYCSKLPLEWQRVVCCKEMLHIFDREPEMTATREQVAGLIERLLGPLSTEDFGVVDFMASRDRLALYQALAVLFPESARRQALTYLADGRTTVDAIATALVLPPTLVRIVLLPEWPSLKDALLNC